MEVIFFPEIRSFVCDITFLAQKHVPQHLALTCIKVELSESGPKLGRTKRCMKPCCFPVQAWSVLTQDN